MDIEFWKCVFDWESSALSASTRTKTEKLVSISIYLSFLSLYVLAVGTTKEIVSYNRIFQFELAVVARDWEMSSNSIEWMQSG